MICKLKQDIVTNGWTYDIDTKRPERKEFIDNKWVKIRYNKQPKDGRLIARL